MNQDDNNLNIYSAPKAEIVNTDNHIYRLKKSVVLSNADAIWPERCAMCNEDIEEKTFIKFIWVTPWAAISILISPVVYIILYLILRKKYQGYIPLCETHIKKRKNIRIAMNISAFILLPLYIYLVLKVIDNLNLVIPICIFAVIMFIVMIFIYKKILRLVKIKKGEYYFNGAGEEFLDSLDEK